MIKAAIFDWDGTVVDSFQILLEAWQEVFKGYSEEEFRGCFGGGARGVIEKAAERRGMEVDDEIVKRLIEKRGEAQKRLVPKTRVLPGVLELLEELGRKGVDLAVCSANHSISVMPTLRYNGLDRYFKTVMTADRTRAEEPKPDPGIFLHTAEVLGRKPADCCVFEDSPMGIEAGKRAGMTVIGVETGPFERKDLLEKKPDLLLENLSDTKRVLDYLGL